MEIEWDDEKNAKLKAERGLSFEEIAADAEEQAIEDNLDSWISMPSEKKSAFIAELKGASIRKPVTVRMDVKDIDALKQLAEAEGLPYQTLLGSVIHKFVSGRLVDLNEARKILKRA